MISGNAWKWIANLFLISSGILVSVSIQASVSWWAYTGFAIGHSMWIVAGRANRDLPLIWLNIAFLFIDFYAISIRNVPVINI